MSTDVQRILKEVAKSSWVLMAEEPFYAHFFAGLLKEVTADKIPTLAVGASGEQVMLYINPNFWDENLNYNRDGKNLPANIQKTQNHRMGVIKHEVLHIVFKHIFRNKDFGHKLIFNVAADLVVNQYIAESYLPKGAVLLSMFPEMEFKRDQDLQYYYDKLLKLYQKMEAEELGKGGEGDESGQGGGGKMRIRRSGGDAGGGNNSGAGEAGKENSERNLKELLDQHKELHQKHQLWEELENMPSSERDLIEVSVNSTLQSTLNQIKTRGSFDTLPQGLKEYLRSFEQSLRPIVDWRRVLRLFAESSSRTYIRNTLKRPSKRYGTNPGIKIRRKQKVLVALDTSGSIIQDELADFFSEVYHIWRQGAEIWVVECDTQIQNQWAYKGTTPEIVTGRGGTQFDAPIRFANEDYHPDALIYFTDGFAPLPKLRSRCPVLWLISPRGLDENAGIWSDLQGRIVKMIR